MTLLKNTQNGIPDDQQKELEKALLTLRQIFPDQPILCVVAFHTDDGVNVCSASNITYESQMELLNILTENFTIPKNTTLN